MTTNDFNPEISNSNFNSAQYYIDDDGGFKFLSPYLSSSDFDGTIPVLEEAIDAQDIKPGMLLLIDGLNYYPVVSISYDDPELEASPSTDVTIGYIGANSQLTIKVYNATDQVNVRYEDWDNKDLGSRGWTITSGGNAIFANVGVRGDLEATTLDVGGVNGITYDGSTVTIGASVIVNAPITFNGVTEEELSSALSGYIPDGSAAADIISNSTTITGGNIFTGTIQSQYYSYASGLYSNNGMQVGLDGNGYIRSPNFYLDTSGNAYFRGEVNAAAGFFGTTFANWKIGSVTNGNRMAIETDTLKLYTQTTSGVDHGNISFYSSNGSTFTGTIANALSQTDKTIQGLGNGLFIGTVDDYIFIPGSGNSNRARTKTSGFEWYASDGTTKIMSITGGAGGLSVFTGDITLTGGGTFIGDGSGLTNLPGGGGSYTLTNSDIIALPAVPNNSTGAKVLYGRILSSVPADASSYPDNSIVIIT